jgi:hypothetical protein
MDITCGLTPNSIIGNYTSPTNSSDIAKVLRYSDFADSRQNIQPCDAATYLRPDPGGCLMPWPYTLAWILIHFPITLLRVQMWERVQALSILLAMFSVFVTIQSYTTHMSADQILVWMPLAIVLDIGAMMQLVFLIVQENGVVLLWYAFRGSILGVFGDGRSKKAARQLMIERPQTTEYGEGTSILQKSVQR